MLAAAALQAMGTSHMEGTPLTVLQRKWLDISKCISHFLNVQRDWSVQPVEHQRGGHEGAGLHQPGHHLHPGCWQM